VVEEPHATPPAPAVGEVANCTMGIWNGEPTSYAYQWQRDGAPIAEAGASADYTIAAADVGASVTCQLTASNAAGSSAPAISNAIGPIAAAA
jgi:hypothetical protein